jgi:TonB family protein
MKNLCFAATVLCASVALAGEAPVSNDEVKKVVESHMGDVKGCLKSHGLPTGKLVVEFAIEPDGHVKESKPKEHSSSSAVDGCIAKLFTSWTFPKPHGGVVAGEVYPFQFAAAKPKAPVEGKLDQKVIISTVNGKKDEVKACYDAALKEKKDDINGTVNVAMVISAEGKITEAKVNNTTTNTPKLDQCILDHLKTWTFPKPNPPGEVAIIYPFVFSSGKEKGDKGGTEK